MKQSQHYAEGDGDCPPLIPGSLRCYNMKYCPFAQRTLLVLAHKNVKFDVVNINLKRKPSWFLVRTPPPGKVPTLEREDGSTICESLVTMEYLEEAHPEPAILPRDPWSRAQDKILAQQFVDMPRVTYKAWYQKHTPGEVLELLGEISKVLDALEAELVKRNTEFYSGDKPGYVDFAFWPWFERLPVSEELLGTKVLTGKYAKLTAWVQCMLQVPAVKTVLNPPSEYLEYLRSIVDGVPNYDFNLKN